jgi:TRAP-type C4-dicarboxylate transport system substrate-binding protein
MNILRYLPGRGVAGLALGAIAAASMFAGSAQARTLSYASSSPPTDTGINLALKWWADELSKRTDGELEVEVHYMGSLVKLKDAVGGVSAGLADMAYVIPAYSQSRMPLHYLSTTGIGPGDQYAANEAWSRMYERFPQLEAELERNNMVYLSNYSIGPSVLLSKDKPYYTPSDFEGDKVRLASKWARAARLEGWNVTSVNLTFPDIYSALERGTIDGAQSYLNYVQPYKHHEVANHVVEPNIGQQTNIVVMNKRTYDSLTEKQQQVIEDLKDEWLVRFAEGDIQDNKDARRELENDPDYPTQVHELSEEQRQQWSEAMQASEEAHIEQVMRRDDAARELFEAYQAEIEKVVAEIEQNGYPWE